MEQTRKTISKLVPKYRDYLGLTEWEINIDYIDGDCEENPDVAMNITIDISYLRARLKVFRTTWEDCDKSYIKRILVHELCHIITEPMYSLCRANVNPHLYPFIEEQREQETERIARIAQRGLGLL